MTPDVTRKTTKAEDAWAAAFAQAGAWTGAPQLHALRKDGFDTFSRLGIPTRRNEAWHYSDLRAAVGDGLPLAGAPDTDAVAAARAAVRALPAQTARIVFVDGFYQAALSHLADESKISVRALDDVLARHAPDVIAALAGSSVAQGDAIVALNAAFMRGGAVIDIADGHHAAAPLELVFVTSQGAPRAIVTRSLLRAGAGSRAQIVERHLPLGSNAVHANEALVVHAAAGAQIGHVRIQTRVAAKAVFVRSFFAHMDAGAVLRSTALTLGGGFQRQQIFVRFASSDANLFLGGASLLRGKDHADTTLVVEHAVPHCESREYFKQIVDEDATGVFQGKIIVAPDAQKTNGVMKSQTILLGANAAMYNKPELEIFADDVACGHGATVGALDDNQLFYAMSRGLPKAKAQALLLEGFAGDAFDDVKDEALREEMMELVGIWLAERSAP